MSEIINTNIDNADIAELMTGIEKSMSVAAEPYQTGRSSEIRTNISYLLNNINQSSYSYVLYINDFIRNNVKDASFLRQSLIEKIQANMGD